MFWPLNEGLYLKNPQFVRKSLPRQYPEDFYDAPLMCKAAKLLVKWQILILQPLPSSWSHSGSPFHPAPHQFY